MSRIGSSIINVPDGVTVDISEAEISVKGKKGELSCSLDRDIDVTCDANVISVKLKNDVKQATAMWGTTRSLINNLVHGVSQGFEKKIEISGVGYRAQLKGENLVLQLGFSHEVQYQIPSGIKIECTDQTLYFHYLLCQPPPPWKP